MKKKIFVWIDINFMQLSLCYYIQKEIDYFSKSHEKSYERTYGWNWLLKLQLELEKSKLNSTLELANNLNNPDMRILLLDSLLD